MKKYILKSMRLMNEKMTNFLKMFKYGVNVKGGSTGSIHYINLQLFAGEKTEKATPKKRQEARSKGQVMQSRELTAALVLITMIICLKIFGSNIYDQIAALMKKVIADFTQTDDIYTLNGLTKLFMETSNVILRTVGPIMAVALAVGITVSRMQVGSLFTTQTLGMKFSKLNPLNGFKRMFSLDAFTELLKSVIKITIVSFVAYTYLKGEVNNVINLMNLDVMNIAVYIVTISINVAIRICLAFIVLGILDYIYQWWSYEKNLKMSKHEVKEEHKQAEGNPEVKAKIRQKQRQISMRRMLQEVPKADVIITNPTHFAVAIKYDTNTASAPVVIAKGQDFIALRIKEVAKENNVEIVENKPLARTLHDTVEIGETIPPELYQAVAEVLAFVYSLKNNNRAG